MCQNQWYSHKGEKNLLQISVLDIYNGMILQSSEGVIFGARTVDGKFSIGDKSLSNYILIYI